MGGPTTYNFSPLKQARHIRLVKVGYPAPEPEPEPEPSAEQTQLEAQIQEQSRFKKWLHNGQSRLRTRKHRKNGTPEPVAPKIPSKVVFTLTEVPLDQIDEPYIALSYAWGDPAPKQTIYSETGRKLVVPQNLGDMLKQLSSLKISSFLWIDALCIDQSSVPERNSQVRLMKEIYGKAEKVYVWFEGLLSNSNKRLTSKAKDQLETLYKLFSDLKNDDAYFDTRVQDIVFNLSRLKHGDQSDGLIYLFAKPWFRRVWPIQEIVTAKRVVFLWGNVELDWDVIGLVVHSLSRYSIEGILVDPDAILDTKKSEKKNSLLPPGYVNARVVEAMRRSYWSDPNSRAAFLELLVETMQFEATDPVDKIFALLGLAVEDSASLPEVDYSLPAATLYLSTTAELMRSTSSLRPLSSAGIGCQRGDTNIPSWVPDYSTAPALFPLERLARNQKWSACGAIATSPIVVTGRMLQLVAFLADTVSITSPPVSALDSSAIDGMVKAVPEWFEWCIQSALSLSPYPTDEDWRQVLRDLLVANPRTEAHQQLHVTSDSLEWDDILQLLVSPFPGMKVQGLQKFLNARLAPFVSWATNRKFFVTTDGYIGLGPEGVQSGDFLVITPGMSTILIIRKNPNPGDLDVYTLVGDSCIQGLMHGEGLPSSKWSNIMLD